MVFSGYRKPYSAGNSIVVGVSPKMRGKSDIGIIACDLSNPDERRLYNELIDVVDRYR